MGRRISLRLMMGWVALASLAAWAYVRPTKFGTAAVVAATWSIVLAGLVLAASRVGASRRFWLGFGVFGTAHQLLNHNGRDLAAPSFTYVLVNIPEAGYPLDTLLSTLPPSTSRHHGMVIATCLLSLAVAVVAGLAARGLVGRGDGERPGDQPARGQI